MEEFPPNWKEFPKLNPGISVDLSVASPKLNPADPVEAAELLKLNPVSPKLYSRNPWGPTWNIQFSFHKLKGL